jgi:hypothetical protein
MVNRKTQKRAKSRSKRGAGNFIPAVRKENFSSADWEKMMKLANKATTRTSQEEAEYYKFVCPSTLGFENSADGCKNMKEKIRKQQAQEKPKNYAEEQERKRQEQEQIRQKEIRQQIDLRAKEYEQFKPKEQVKQNSNIDDDLPPLAPLQIIGRGGKRRTNKRSTNKRRTNKRNTKKR